jgi:hypothetical protein
MVTIAGGTDQNLGLSFVTVRLGATMSEGSTVLSEGGISIAIRGMECHVIQLITRRFFVEGSGLEAKTWTGMDGTLKATTVDINKPEVHVDTADLGSPYYDSHPGSPCTRGSNSFIMYDHPDMENGTLKWSNRNDWSAFDALSYCLSDGALVGIVWWRVRQTAKGGPRNYETARMPIDNVLVTEGNKVLLARGFKSDFIPFKSNTAIPLPM